MKMLKMGIKQDTQPKTKNSTANTENNTEAANKCMDEYHTLRACVTISITLCKKYRIQSYLKSCRILKNILLTPQDMDTIKQKGGGIYWLRCSRLNCDEEYTGESARPFGKRLSRNISKHLHNRNKPQHIRGGLQHSR